MGMVVLAFALDGFALGRSRGLQEGRYCTGQLQLTGIMPPSVSLARARGGPLKAGAAPPGSMLPVLAGQEAVLRSCYSCAVYEEFRCILRYPGASGGVKRKRCYKVYSLAH